MTQARAITLNTLSLYAVALVLAAAYAAQFILHELPCPLCLLQRILFAALAVGPILNIRFGPRPSHYAMSLLAAILLFDRQFEEDKVVLPATGGAFAQTAVWLVIALTAANVVTTLLECGFGACAD